MEEIGELNRVVVMYLDYAEDQARRRKPLYMSDWRDKIDAFLKFNERAILEDAEKSLWRLPRRWLWRKFRNLTGAALPKKTTQEEEEFEKIAKQLERKGRRKKEMNGSYV